MMRKGYFLRGETYYISNIETRFCSASVHISVVVTNSPSFRRVSACFYQ